MKPLPIILAAIFLSGNCSSKIDHRSFFLQYGRLNVREVKTESVRVACENIRFSSLFAETSPSAKNKEKRMFSQATVRALSRYFGIKFLSLEIR